MKACVDIGGTKVAVSLVDDASSGDLPAPMAVRVVEPTVKTGEVDALARQVLALIDTACARVGIERSSLVATGVSSCGPFVLIDDGIEVANPNICGGLAGSPRGIGNAWTHIPLEAPLRAALGRVRIANDAVAALVAERRWGALKGSDNCAYVTWSTGVGVGLCVDGRVLRGKNGNAGHAGHSFVVDGDPAAVCGCGNRGDVESMIAGGSLEHRIGRDAASLMAAAAGGDAQADAAVQRLCEIMGRLLYNLTATLDLQRISLGGSVFLNHSTMLLPRLERELHRYFPALTHGLELRAAGLADKVGDYAALALVCDDR
ncbi:ROK family protein [Diaphorobacter aerolatus]|uniref:ROK family protein n=1 Tax=Diaphorobacter aerolatus TaxID=1288495 RepID=A0A7H0GNZ6_9BURK|nr:ROK family protein [Diaphorobacter aerolatus]QNP50012.1 ROK family protein [Diaphorobacter aerolatus]